MTKKINYTKDSHMGKRGLIMFYKKMLTDGKIQVGGAAHQRLKRLDAEYINDSKGYSRTVI